MHASFKRQNIIKWYAFKSRLIVLLAAIFAVCKQLRPRLGTPELLILNLTTLELRRHRGDLIETFKILKGLEGIPLNSLFELNTSVTRGNSLKLNKQRSRLNIRYNNFSQRVINAWNRLPERVISSTTVNGFKNNLDRHFQELHGVSMTRSLNP